jgi:hypothetical protein
MSNSDDNALAISTPQEVLRDCLVLSEELKTVDEILRRIKIALFLMGDELSE